MKQKFKEPPIPCDLKSNDLRAVIPCADDNNVISAANTVTVTTVNGASSEISDHNARVHDLLDDDGPALTDAERAASVEWIWKPGVGLVQG